MRRFQGRSEPNLFPASIAAPLHVGKSRVDRKKTPYRAAKANAENSQEKAG
jgi:hypothetical protein